MFQIGDKVREGTRIGTVTDVGTVLIQVTTNEGVTRVVCPWELVRIRAPHERPSSQLAPHSPRMDRCIRRRT